MSFLEDGSLSGILLFEKLVAGDNLLKRRRFRPSVFQEPSGLCTIDAA